MKKKNMTAIWCALKQAGFSNIGYSEHYWMKLGDIMFVFQHWSSGFEGRDLYCKMQAWTGNNKPQAAAQEMLLSEVTFYLTDVNVSELKPDWIVAHMQELAKKAYDSLIMKAKAAAEIVMMGV